MNHVNVGGSKSRLDEVYTTLLNMIPQHYEQMTQDLGVLAAHYAITQEQAFILKLEADKKRHFLNQAIVNNNNVAAVERARGNADRRRAAQNTQAVTRARQMNKQQYFNNILPQHQQYTMKRSFNAYVKKQYNNTLFHNVNTAVRQVTAVAYRVQLFLLDFTLHHPDNIPPALISQNGLFSITQLVRGRTLTSTNGAFPKDVIVRHWNTMTETQRNLTAAYTTNTKILSDYCQRQSSCISMHLYINFPKRIMQFCRFKLALLLEEVGLYIQKLGNVHD
ncbi:hypothetical protein [Absidia glauca]|uniref:Uncharacterized protein n=1 Tax=Absidia glauca TaxID=4829 RepID=A0A168TAP7_ABSGL|nr:hypothetical protein [Absidia glauca]